MDDSMDIALQSLQYLTLGLISGDLYDQKKTASLRSSKVETTEEYESESLKRKRDYEDIKRKFYHESNRTE